MSVLDVRLPVLVVGQPLEQRAADPLRHRPANLALDDLRIDHRAAVLDRDDATHPDPAGARVDLHDRDDTAVRVGRSRVVERRG